MNKRKRLRRQNTSNKGIKKYGKRNVSTKGKGPKQGLTRDNLIRPIIHDTTD